MELGCWSFPTSHATTRNFKSAPRSRGLHPADFIPRFDAAARRTGFKTQAYGHISGHPLNAYTRRTPGVRPRVYLSSGMHGDEPAPPLALLKLAEEGFFDDRCTWFVCPMLNPTGFTLHTRGNFDPVDLNRDYKSLLAAAAGPPLVGVPGCFGGRGFIPRRD